MTCNILISWRQLRYVFLPNLKSRSDVIHLFAYIVPQKGISVLFVKCLLHRLEDLEDKLMCSNPILWPQLTMMRLRFSSTFRIHHANAGSPAIRCCTAYLAIYTGYKFFISLRVTHVVFPSFHWTRTSTPFVVSLQCFVTVSVVMNASWYFTSVQSYLWSTISWNRACQFPYILNWSEMFSAIALVARKALWLYL